MIFLPVFLALLAFFASLAPAIAQSPRAERPTYTVGDQWILDRGGVFDLIRIENDLYIFAAENGREIHLSRDLTVARFQNKRGKFFEFSPPPKLEWPLEVGKSGWGQIAVDSPRMGSDEPRMVEWKVEAYEDVEVAAGTFKAFRIVYSFWVGPERLKERKFSAWYAPEVEQIVKMEGWKPSRRRHLFNFEVVAIDRPETAPLQVALEEPRDQTYVTTEEIVVAGKATSGKGITRVTVTLNGTKLTSRGDPLAPKNEMDLNLPIKLREGRNVLIVTAVDAAGETRQEARTLFYDKPKPALALPPTAIAKPLAPPTQPPAKPAAPEPPKVVPPPAPPFEVAPLPPLEVTISSPRDQARVEHESIGLAGLVSGGKGVSRVIVTLNGVELSRMEERTPQRAIAVNIPVKLRDGQNTLVVTATDGAGATHQEVRTVHYEKQVPLTVAFRYPEDRSRVTDESSVVAAVITSSKGVAKVTVTLNGAEVHRQKERTPQKSVAVSIPVTLRKGANAIVISASEPDGNVRQQVRTVIYDPPKVAEVVLPPPKVPPKRNRWAVVIGVGRYDSPGVPTLRYAVADAEAIYEVLIGPVGFKREHVLLLTDKTKKKPTLRNIKWALGTFLARSAYKNDTVIIFFAGHGAPEVDQRGIERDGLAKYLIPRDAEPDDLYSTALPMDEIRTIFGRIEAERVVAFLDTCYSGAAGGRTFASKRTRAGHIDDLFLERLTRSKGRAIITASRPAEVSMELDELGHGIFTYYLVQGFKGAADLNRDGIVSLQELYEYVEEQVSRKSRSVGGNQHPVMKGELEGVLPLVKVSGR